jgi:hypothetical protein
MYVMPMQTINYVLLNPLDSRKTKLLKAKTAEFSINNKKGKITIFLLKNPKNSNIILV